MTERLSKPIFGMDSYGPLPVAIHHEVYSKFAGRYTSHTRGKALTAAEYRDDKAGGIALVSVFEDNANNAVMGYEQGKSDALFAEQQTKDAGRPDGRPIYFAVDMDVSQDVTKIDPYFDGVASVLGKDHCGPYGGYSTVAHLFDKGFKWGWQTAAWSYGNIDKRAQVYQYEFNLKIGGFSVDYNHAYYHDFGQWGYTPPPPPEKHDYNRFYPGPFVYNGRTLDERALVEEYDKLIKHPALNHKKLLAVRADLLLCAERIASLASVDRVPGKRLPPEWSAFDRGWRYMNIIHRYQGRVVR
jgi:hypothetical protein